MASDTASARIASTFASRNVSHTAAPRASRSSTRMRARADLPESPSSWYTGRCSERARSKRRHVSAPTMPLRQASVGSDRMSFAIATGSPNIVAASTASTTRSKSGFNHQSATHAQSGVSWKIACAIATAGRYTANHAA